MRLKLLGAALSALLLSGCQGLVQTEINLSELKSSEVMDLPSTLYLEIPACNSYEDSRLESDSLKKAKVTVVDLFPKSAFKECFTKRFKTYASFSLPLKIDRVTDGVFESADTLNLTNREKGMLLGIGIPKRISDKLTQLEKDSLGTQTIDLDFDVMIKNDTQEQLNFKAISAYIDDAAYVYGEFELDPGSKVKVSVSRVAVEHAKREKVATVLLYN